MLWIQEHLLVIAALGITLILIYHYIIEKEYGIRLSKRYRSAIFETQSKIFLNASQYLISGNKDLAIKEFLNAVEINKETLETYFALGGLFRSNGEIEKAISIHRSLIARNNISESTRLRALKELATDFDKGGFIDKAIETYQDVLEINRDQVEVILSLCRIHEDIEEWDEAYKYRIMLSKVTRENQSETISHILVQKAKKLFMEGHFADCLESLEEAFKFSPSVSAKILRLKLYLIEGDMDGATALLMEMLKEHPLYASFIFMSLDDQLGDDENTRKTYMQRFSLLKKFFLDVHDKDIQNSPSVVLSKIRLFKDENRLEDAHQMLKDWMLSYHGQNEVLKAEYIKLLIHLGKKDEALENTLELLNNLHHSLTKHYCSQCGYNSDSIFWRCPQCREWETIQFRWKV
jgi:lipopolysaccharide biosynthesis regulator YciM